MRSFLLATLALAACAEPRATSCEATVDDDVRTRLHVTWAAPAGGESWVEFSAEGRAPLVAPAADDGEGRSAVLVGAGPLEDVDWAAITEIDGRRWTCEGTISTGNTPSGLPTIEVTTWTPERASPERFMLGSLQTDLLGMVFLVDREGRLVWSHVLESGRALMDAEPAGGSRVVWNAFSTDFATDLGELRTGSVLGGPVEAQRTFMAHHVFTGIPDGYAWLALDVRDWTDPATGETRRVAGDAIMTRGADGVDRTVWSTWDTFEVEPFPGWDEPPFYEDVVDWTHGNGLNWDAERGSYLYSSARLATVAQIDAETGAVIDSYGAKGEYGFEPPTMFAGQHDPSFTPEGTLLLSHRDLASGRTEAAEWEIDRETRTIRRIWSGGTDHGLTAHWFGQATRLANGNTLAGYGSAGVLQEITPDGEVVWELRLGLGATMGMATLVDDPQAMPE